MGEIFDTSVLDKALAVQAARAEEERKLVLNRLFSLLPEAATRFDFRQIYLFGSLATERRFQAHSDVDLAVVKLPAEHFFPLAAFLASHLGREVDLVMLEDVHFADKIRREGIEWTKSAG